MHLDSWGKPVFIYGSEVEKAFLHRGLSEVPNGYGFSMLLGYGPRNWLVSSSALICRFQCSWARNLPVRGPITNQPHREPYFSSSHMLYLIGQSTRLSCCLIMNHYNCKTIGAKKQSGWRGTQIYAPFLMQSTHLGSKRTLCAVSPANFYTGRFI
jgi:hypothetical protein